MWWRRWGGFVHHRCVLSHHTTMAGHTFTHPPTQTSCRQKAIEFCKPGRSYKDIGGIIEEFVTKAGYTTVREFCGHGVGKVFHTTPNVLHFKCVVLWWWSWGWDGNLLVWPWIDSTHAPLFTHRNCHPPRNNQPAGVMQPGHTFTIEPMICEGTNKHILWPVRLSLSLCRVYHSLSHPMLCSETRNLNSTPHLHNRTSGQRRRRTGGGRRSSSTRCSSPRRAWRRSRGGYRTRPSSSGRSERFGVGSWELGFGVDG